MERISVREGRFVDEQGRTRIFSGINLVSKGRTGAKGYDFVERFGEREFSLMEDMGFNVVRLGLTWASVEPRPGEYDEARIDWIMRMLDMCERHGIYAVLDMHQDLFAQRFSDGAPDWAVLTDAEYVPTALWSEAYLEPGAVTQAFDAFWADAPVAGVGIMERYARMWRHVARRVGSHPALMAVDIMNEPHPGGLAARAVEQLACGLAEASAAHGPALSPERVLRMFGDADGRMELLSMLEDERVYRAMTDAVDAVDRFEAGALSDMYDRVGAYIRAEAPGVMLMRENCYFGNIGVRCMARAPQAPFAFSPHGYDWLVDTPAVPQSSNARAGFIFARHGETQRRLGAPVMVGEWGGMGRYDGRRHERFLMNVFEREQWSSIYWCWFDGFENSCSAKVLRRAYPSAIAGKLDMYSSAGGRFVCRWNEWGPGSASEIFLPAPVKNVRLDGETLRTAGGRLCVPSKGGARELTAELWGTEREEGAD